MGISGELQRLDRVIEVRVRVRVGIVMDQFDGYPLFISTYPTINRRKSKIYLLWDNSTIYNRWLCCWGITLCILGVPSRPARDSVIDAHISWCTRDCSRGKNMKSMGNTVLDMLCELHSKSFVVGSIFIVLKNEPSRIWISVAILWKEYNILKE